MPDRDTLTTGDLEEAFADSAATERKRAIRLRAIRDKAKHEVTKANMQSLIETARLKEASQEQFDFAKPGEDWGSTTWRRR
jgi:hypothetical protein